MGTIDTGSQAKIDSHLGVESGSSGAFGRFTWHVIRLPMLALLVVLAPLARFVLAAVALLGILMSFFFELSAAAPRFPFWLVFGLSLGCGATVVVLNAAMRRLAR